MTANLETKLGYRFQNQALLQEALTHPSKKLESKNSISYQRLEFLGDKILNFVIAQNLFIQFPNETEGDISRRHAHLVCGTICHEVAKKLDVFPHISFSRGQQKDESSNQTKIGEDVIEAIIGAIFLDGGLTPVQGFIQTQWQEYITGNKTPPKDPKSALQEYMQRGMKSIPQYHTTPKGNAFIAKITVHDHTFEASASTKKEAEKTVAQKVLNFLSSQNLL